MASSSAKRPRRGSAQHRGASRSTPSLRGAAARRLGRRLTHSRTFWRARYLQLSARQPGQLQRVVGQRPAIGRLASLRGLGNSPPTDRLAVACSG
jgi:hypothetical protein